jgi:predicted metalloprotease with PDZ domain
LLPHEFTHSWNGKYRRPAGLATPDYQQPMKGDLLWVYEGLTEYLGKVLAARSGLFTPEQFDDNIAYIASTYDYRSGRTWRPLQDTADAAQLLYFANTEWENWRRSTDYYDEGALIWLDVDTAIRQLTHDQKSIEDFCRSFEGAPGGAPALKTYTFDDIVSALNSVAPNDWHSFLRTRLDSTSPHAPLGGIEHGGWKLVYNDRPNDFITNGAETHNTWDYMSSLGLSVQDDGTVIDVVHDGPAYNAGIGPGMKLTAIDGQQFSSTVLRELVEKSASASAPFTFLVANGPYFKTVTVDYRGGPRYPHLERNNEMPDLLGEIIRPLAPGSATGTEAAAGR